MQIRKAAILAAGFGTRVLPASKAVPKEMLNIADKPAIQYVVEELTESGITDILIIVSRGKQAIMDHFDRAPDLEAALEAKGKEKELISVKKSVPPANISFVRQREQKGTGDAMLYAEGFAAGESIVMAYADDIFIPEKGASHVSAQLINAVSELGNEYGAIAMKEVSDELVIKYSSLKITPADRNICYVSDMNEKPTLETKFSNFAVQGRCVLPPEIYPLLKNLKPGAGGEVQLTDAMAELARKKRMLGVDFQGCKRYDMGNKLGILIASTEIGLSHPETSSEYRQYLKELFKKEFAKEFDAN